MCNEINIYNQKIVFIHIEKCGGTGIRNIILSLYYDENTHDKIVYDDYFNYLDKQNLDLTYKIINSNKLLLFHQNINDMKIFCNNYLHNITAIRNPIKRLLSHYYHMIINKSVCIINGVNHLLFKPYIKLSEQHITFIIDFLNSYGNLIVYRLGFTHNTINEIADYNSKLYFENAIQNISQLNYIFLLEDLDNELKDYKQKYNIINTECFIDINCNKNVNVLYNKNLEYEFEFILNVINENKIINYDILFYNHICNIKNKQQYSIIL